MIEQQVDWSTERRDRTYQDRTHWTVRCGPGTTLDDASAELLARYPDAVPIAKARAVLFFQRKEEQKP